MIEKCVNPAPRWPRYIDGRKDYGLIRACGTIHCSGRKRRLWMAVRVKAEANPGLWSLDVVGGGEHLSDPLPQDEACRVASGVASEAGYLFLPEALVYVSGHFYRNPSPPIKRKTQ